jgi:hypothetical protein
MSVPQCFQKVITSTVSVYSWEGRNDLGSSIVGGNKKALSPVISIGRWVRTTWEQVLPPQAVVINLKTLGGRTEYIR